MNSITEEVAVTFTVRVPYEVTVDKDKWLDWAASWGVASEKNQRQWFKRYIKKLVDDGHLFVAPPQSIYMDRAGYLPALDNVTPDGVTVRLADSGTSIEDISAHVEQDNKHK